MPTQTNEQALEASIEKSLTGNTIENLKQTGGFAVAERDEIYRTGNGYLIGFPENFNAQFAIDEVRFWSFIESTQKEELAKLQKQSDWKLVRYKARLINLCKEEYLISENKGRWTSYRLNIITKVDTLKQKVDSSELEVDTSVQKVDTSASKVDTSVQKVDTSTSKVDTSITSVEETNLKGKKKKMPKQELRILILNYCHDYKSLEDIANAIGREQNYIQNKILPDMVKDGILEKKYPHTPNHPGQAYKASNN